jgi:hypothetical protein
LSKNLFGPTTFAPFDPANSIPHSREPVMTFPSKAFRSP